MVARTQPLEKGVMSAPCIFKSYYWLENYSLCASTLTIINGINNIPYTMI